MVKNFLNLAQKKTMDLKSYANSNMDKSQQDELKLNF